MLPGGYWNQLLLKYKNERPRLHVTFFRKFQKIPWPVVALPVGCCQMKDDLESEEDWRHSVQDHGEAQAISVKMLGKNKLSGALCHKQDHEIIDFFAPFCKLFRRKSFCCQCFYHWWNHLITQCRKIIGFWILWSVLIQTSL